MKTVSNKFPQALIFSTQRSGTHLLLSFLNKHPNVHGRGEIFLKYKRTGQIEDNHPDKLNVAILMYDQLPVFKKLGGVLKDLKIIHLIRDCHFVALSRLQAQADKKKQGLDYQAHYHKEDPLKEQGIPELSRLDQLKNEIDQEQRQFVKLLKNLDHLELKYEEIVQNDQSVEFLDQEVQQRLLRYLDLETVPFRLYTTLIKR